MKISHTALMFGAFLLIDAIIIISIAPNFIPYKGFFPYKEIVDSYNMPFLISSQANFDGAHYLLIASQGYQQFQQALFPLYPLLIASIGSVLGGNHLLAGLVISLSAFFCALVVLNAYFTHIGKKPQEIFWIFLFVLAFPTSYYFHTVYTESLFLLLLSISLYAFAKKNYWLASVASIFTSLTRLIGIFLMPVFLLQRVYEDWHHDTHKNKKKISNLSSLFSSVRESMIRQWQEKKYSIPFYISLTSPLIGLFMYMIYLGVVYDNPLYFIDAQSAFDANRSTDSFVILPQVLYRYIKIFLTVKGDLLYQSLLEFVIFNGVFLVLLLDAWKRWKNRWDKTNGVYVSLLLFSFINMILPTLTGTLSSTTRYTLMSFSFFIFMGEIQNKYLKIGALVVLFLLHALMLGLYVQGYFVG